MRGEKRRAPCRLVLVVSLAMIAYQAVPRASLASTGDQPPRPAVGQRGTVEPAFSTRVDLIVLDARVVDGKGVAPTALTPEDFIVEVDGRPRRVLSAEFLSIDHAAVEARPEDAGITSNVRRAESRAVLFVVDQASLPAAARSMVESAGRWVETLTDDALVGLVSLPPPGPRVEPTTKHSRVVEGLRAVALLSQASAGPALRANAYGMFVSLDEALAIAAVELGTLEQVQARECAGLSGSELQRCKAQVDSLAHDLAADAQSSTAPVLAGLSALIEALGHVSGRKDVILLTGGWPIYEREVGSQMRQLASIAARSRVTVHAIVPQDSALGASPDDGRPARIGMTPLREREMRAQPVEALTSLTGGLSLRLTGGAEGLFQRIADATSTYYRLGVEPLARDMDGKAHRVSVRVTRRGLHVDGYRRAITVPKPGDVTTLTPAELLAQALRTQARVSDIELRVASEVISDGTASGTTRLAVAVEVARALPGAALASLIVTDLDGKPVDGVRGDLSVDERGRATLSSVLSVPEGRYEVRIAVRDGEGLVGTAIHPVEALPTSVGPLKGYGLALLEHVPDDAVPLRPVLGKVPQDARIVGRLDLHTAARGDAPLVRFELRSENEEIIHRQEHVAIASDAGEGMSAEVVLEMTNLRPGLYTLVANIHPEPGEVPLTRRFRVDSVRRVTGPLDGLPAADARPPSAKMVASAAPSVEPLSAPGFDVESLLVPQFVAHASQRASQLDASVRAPLEARMRAGVELLRSGNAAAASQEFREALRVAPGYRIALVYLGACHAASGRPEQAAGAWQTAVVMERDNAELHKLAIDGWLRARRPASALAMARQAHERWPEDPDVRWRLAMSLLGSGQMADALPAVLGLPGDAPFLESMVTNAMAQLYEAWQRSRSLWNVDRDLETMRALRARYPANGQSASIIDGWLRDMSRR